MNCLERVVTTLNHKEPDVVPVGPFAGYYAAEILGVRIDEYVKNGLLIAEAQHQLHQLTGQDIVLTAADTYYIAEAFGLRVEHHDNSLPTATKPVLGTLREARRLAVPDPRRDGRMPVYIEAVRELRKRIGGTVAIRGTGTGPFSIAAYLLGIENLLEELGHMSLGDASSQDRADYTTLLEITSDTCIAFQKAQIAEGLNIAYLGDSLSSVDVISPEMYRAFVMPWHKKVFDGIRDCCKSYGVHTMLHSCGDNTELLQSYAEIGVDLYEVDSAMDLRRCKLAVGHKLSLIGNLNPTGTLLNGSVEDVRRESDACIMAGAEGGGFVLGSGCFVAPNTPLANIQAMVNVGHNHHY
jgi:uroporphyrinogen decarboxylase